MKGLIMRTNLAAIALAAAVVAVAAPAFARDEVANAVRESIPLKGGAILHIFKDGKMAKEDRVGRAVPLRSGEVLEALDGRKVTVQSNEVARLHLLLDEGHRN
jgi:hypothetical protein